MAETDERQHIVTQIRRRADCPAVSFRRTRQCARIFFPIRKLHAFRSPLFERRREADFYGLDPLTLLDRIEIEIAVYGVCVIDLCAKPDVVSDKAFHDAAERAKTSSRHRRVINRRTVERSFRERLERKRIEIDIEGEPANIEPGPAVRELLDPTQDRNIELELLVVGETWSQSTDTGRTA